MNMQLLVRPFMALLLVAGMSEITFARGTESGGGGDPDAVDFLLKVNTIGEWALRTRAGLTDSDAQVVNANAKKLSHLMDDPAATPIVMVDQNLVDVSGASKVALFDQTTFKIQVTRSKWKSLNDEDKFVVAALELFGLSRIEDRYAVAGIIKREYRQIVKMVEVVDQNWSYISAIKVGGVVTYEAPGIYNSHDQIIPMAMNINDVDVDFETHVMGLKMATEYCKALGHDAGVSVSFKPQSSGTIGAFFKLSQGYIGLRLMNVSSIQPDLAVRHLNCK